MIAGEIMPVIGEGFWILSDFRELGPCFLYMIFLTEEPDKVSLKRVAMD